jgi:DNA-binding XRE family transcriptional regulator
MPLKNNLQSIRIESLTMTQTELATETGVSVSSIRATESQTRELSARLKRKLFQGINRVLEGQNRPLLTFQDLFPDE